LRHKLYNLIFIKEVIAQKVKKITFSHRKLCMITFINVKK